MWKWIWIEFWAWLTHCRQCQNYNETSRLVCPSVETDLLNEINFFRHFFNASIIDSLFHWITGFWNQIQIFLLRSFLRFFRFHLRHKDLKENARFPTILATNSSFSTNIFLSHLTNSILKGITNKKTNKNPHLAFFLPSLPMAFSKIYSHVSPLYWKAVSSPVSWENQIDILFNVHIYRSF